MRMDEMNKLFEEQGFEVKRKWIKEKDCYEFYISRDGEDLWCNYTYPQGVTSITANEHQRRFVESSIELFEMYYHAYEKAIPPHMDVDPCFGKKPPFSPTQKYLFKNSCFGKKPPFSPTQKYLFKNHTYIKPNFNKKLETSIKDVIFSPPATIVKWDDGTKTVVKVQNGEDYDPEKGLAMAISKKALGNSREYYHTFLHWLKKYEKEYVKAEQFGIPSSVINKPDEKKRDAIKNAYAMLVHIRVNPDEKIHDYKLDDIIGFLGQALED